MTPPAFSVIMPVWNRAEIVHRAINSVLAQEFSDYELIIIDDGSTDDLGSVLEPYLGDPRIRFCRTSHRGVSATRNTGIREARGTYIAYLDSDNTWAPLFLKRMHAAVASPGRAEPAAYCRFNQYSHIPFLKIFYRRRVIGKPFILNDLLKKNFIDTSAFVHRRDCVTETGMWDESLKRLVDWDFIIRLTARYPPVFVPEVLVDYYFGICDNCITKQVPLKPALQAVREKIRLMQKP